MERTADLPASSRAWPTTLPTGQVVVGEGPVRSTGFSRVLPGVSVLDAQDVKYDALILRFTVALELDAQDAIYDALILRFTEPFLTS